jgi:nucleoside-diphosphate-sugar epimerase
MNVLVIGGSGGLSSVLASKALDKYKVYTLTRGERTLPEGVVSLKADRNNLDAFKEAINSANVHFDVVFDCICMNKEHAKADIEILAEYTDRLIVVSTDSVFDGKCKKTPEDESGVCLKADGDTKDCDYAQNKRQMERVFLNEMSSRSSGLKITIFRPGHIYCPGFLLGCFPEHSRQKDLVDHIISNKPIRLVGMGTYLIHPIFVDDLAETMIDCVQNDKTFNEIFCIGGPEAVENRIYYEYIADILGVDINVQEIPLTGYLDAYPEYAGHLCHRIYDLSKLRNTGVKMPSTHLYEGIRKTLNK